MVSAADARASLCGKLGLKPVNAQNLLFYYVPLQGAISYTSLSVNVMNPSLILRLFPRKDITNVLLVNTLVGSGLYLYNKPHLTALTKRERIIYSAFGAVAFSLSSVLIWAILRSVIPENVTLSTICGIGSGLAMIKIGRSYVEHLDSLVKK